MTFPAQQPAPAPDQPMVIRDADHALSLLRNPDESVRIEARRYLANLFEQRGMLEEAIDLLEANGHAGATDTTLFTALAGLYRRVGRDRDADMALAAATRTLAQQPPAPPISPAFLTAQPPAYPTAPPGTYYPAPQQPIQVTVNPTMSNVVHTHVNVKGGSGHPPVFIRLLYLLFIGWWFGFLWIGLSLALFVPIVTIPIAVWMLGKTPEAFFL